ncbi:equilibrative nucleoside transporter 4-like [Macrosteles quadrilineatus]|uniref:equilibrative nucleoside transporter 4-like n=1 Tax=Macrosteles quadrilineatus TaxID=74068 RepID=UPI0023E2AA8C|nr:equilibrative nucleoside transporter 4-like [Macrosteles quadrilineatus]XP_054288372.1 equilibrative nucleoside transporter 4-like [Macrosteles quadrilineatus]
MDENLSRGYIQLGKARGANDFRFTNGFSHLSPPVDKFNGIYLSLVLAGVGFLLPYNSFIIAVDYFQAQYPNSTIVFDMSLVYIVMAFFAVLANNILVETLSLNTRITFGYVVSFFTLLFVATCEIWWEIFGSGTSYTINLIAVAVVALGCTVQQSSFYGYTSMLPSRYTQAVMAGESGAGFLVSANRILTKMVMDDQRANTLIFFGVSVMMVALCFCLHQMVRRTDFVQFYLTLCRESRRITLEPTEDAGLMDPLDQVEGASKSQYGVLKLQPQSPMDAASGQHFSFANPVYEPSGTNPVGPSYKVEDVVVRMRSTTGSGSYRRTNSTRAWAAIKKGLVARWEVARNVWHYMLSIALAYFVTLCLYPGIESEIVSCKFGNWMPVILMAGFNAADLMGKVVASVPYEWSRSQLLVFASLRAVLIPLLVLCATPRGSPVIPGEGYPLLFSLLLGLTNGLVGSVPMIQAPSRVSEEHRELTGNIMTLSYNVGLTGGSLVAYVLDAMLGPPLVAPCRAPPRYFTPNPRTMLANLTTPYTTVAATTAVTVATVLTTSPTTLTSLANPTTLSNLTLALYNVTTMH